MAYYIKRIRKKIGPILKKGHKGVCQQEKTRFNLKEIESKIKLGEKKFPSAQEKKKMAVKRPKRPDKVPFQSEDFQVR